MRIVVTGASGNIGVRLLEQLHGQVEEVVAIARRPPTGGPPYLTERVVWHDLDLSEASCAPRLRSVLAGADVVVHLAWLIQPSHDPAAMRATNVGGSARVLQAVLDAGVPALVHASSVGAYSPAPKDQRVEESWPTHGIPGSLYSAHKSEVERLLDTFERDSPHVRVARIRPGVVVQRAAGSEQGRYFLGPFLPLSAVRPELLPVLPVPRGLRIQVVHTSDAAAAFAAAALGEARGAFNIATEPPLDAVTLAQILGRRVLGVPALAARVAVEAAWRARLLPTDRGWLELGLRSPVMDTGRAARELAWHPAIDAGQAVRDALAGVASRAGGPTAALRAVRGPWDQLISGLRTLIPGSGGRI